MSKSIYSMIPDAESLLSLEPEELAGVVLEYLNSLSEHEQGRINRRNFSLPYTVQDYPPEYRDRILQALMEAWIWLEREGLIAPNPGSEGDWVFITRRGRKLTNKTDVQAYHRANKLPKQLLHPVIGHKVWASFLRGDYDTAVFQSFKEIEICVRLAGQYSDEVIGIDLMRKSFHPHNGPLTNKNVPVAERESLMHLFSGAIGSYKNPHSHRNVKIDANEAVEMIILASHLLNIVDSLSKSTK